MRLPRGSSIRCSTSQCALPMVNLGRLDSDWYEGITQKLKWNVPIREEKSEADQLALLASVGSAGTGSGGSNGAGPLRPSNKS